jgi:outer membrane protein TolC
MRCAMNNVKGAKMLSRPVKIAAVVMGLIVVQAVASTNTVAAELTYDDAITIAVNRSSRGAILRGDLEVAEKGYFARRVRFYVPEISLDASTPAYSSRTSWDRYGRQRQLTENSSLDFNSKIVMNQSLVTGGDLSIGVDLTRNEYTYPKSDDDWNIIGSWEETTRKSDFSFELTQPVLKPSQSRNELHNYRDDLEVARVVFIQEQAALKKEVAEAYFGVLQLTVQTDMASHKLRSGQLTAEVDSIKFSDGVCSEEDWIESASARLDAELEQFDTENQLKENSRLLAALLDMDATEPIQTAWPVITQHLTEEEKHRLIDSHAESLPVIKARYEYDSRKRAADFASGSHGINGDLVAKYAVGRGTVTGGEPPDDDIKTNSWEIMLNLSYPIFDGGASSAAVQAEKLSAEKSRLEYERVEKAARAEILNLINRLDVGYRKLGVLQKQIGLAENRLGIARFRFDDGQITEVEFLGSAVFHLEVRDKYLEGLKQYLLDRIDLEAKYSS